MIEQEQLSQFGSEGWELCNYVDYTPPSLGLASIHTHRYTFKREVKKIG